MAEPSSYRPAPGSIPTDPGVYRFFDAHDIVIYVGKAKNLRQRLNSYFADPASLGFRTQTMVRTATRVEWTVVRNELESLQLEYTWIKHYDPRFNIKYRDDKSYPWLAITASDEFPRVLVGRGSKRKGWRYYGPFGQAWAIRETVDALLHVFPMRSCSNGVFRNAAAAGRPCLLGYIGKCAAPCVGRVSADEHREIVEDFATFMSGQSRALTRKLTRQMQQASENLEFERAAVLRDSLGALEKATESNAIVFSDGTDADVVALAEDPLEVAVHIFSVRGGRVRGERGWVADRADDSGTGELVESFLLQLYATANRDEGSHEVGANIPRDSLVPQRPESADLLEEVLAAERPGVVRIRVPQRGDKRSLLETVSRNADQTLQKHKMRRSSDLSVRNRALQEIAEYLGLETAPLRIECYDVSHLQGTEVVASMVVFEDGLARRSEYRRFVIKSFEGSNDVAAMREVLTRRLRRLLDDRAVIAAASDQQRASGTLIDPVSGAPRKFAYAPALIVVDGGAPQVNVAAEVLAELMLEQEIAVIGLAKRLEEVWLPDTEYPLVLPRSSEALYLLQRVRDEAHRFAITHHRGRRSKAMVESVLDDVPGLGEVRRKALLTHFGSLRRLRAATAEEIAQVPGFGPQLVQSVQQALHAHPAGDAVNMTTGEVLT